MELTDPLGEFRAGQAGSVQELETFLDQQGITDATVYRRGGPPVAVTDAELFLVDDGSIYRIGRDRVVGLGETRAADKSLMRWGVLLYLAALPLLVVVPIAGGMAVAGLMAIAGGVLVAKGYLSTALLIQVDDDRVPPFVVDHSKSKRIRSSLEHWA